MNKKYLFLVLVLTGTVSRLFSAPSFSGEAGAATTFINKDANSIDPALMFNGYFSGQLTIKKSLILRGEFSLRTEDSYDSDIFSEVEGRFRLNELSGTYIKPFFGALHSFSLFLGYFESVGTGTYIARQLGVQNYASPLTDNYLGQNGAVVHPFHGIGGAYSLKFSTIPLSLGMIVSRNDDNDDEEDAQLNVDWRIAAAFKYLAMDCSFGIGAPLRTKNKNGEDVVLLIDTLYFHTGMDILLGNRDTLSLLFQSGFEYLPLKSSSKSKEIDAKDIYLLVEPRFSSKPLCLYYTLFSVPETMLSKMTFIDETMGVNISIFSNALRLFDTEFQLGINGTASFPGKNFKNIADSDFAKDIQIKLSPFFGCDVLGGKLKAMLQINTTKIAENGDNPIKLTFGYKKNL